MEPLFFVPNYVEEVFCWMSSDPGSAKRHDEVMQARCAKKTATTTKQKMWRGSAARKAACVQGDAGGDEVWNWSFAFQDIWTLHVRKCKLEFRCCGIQKMDSSMGFMLVLWVHKVRSLVLFDFFVCPLRIVKGWRAVVGSAQTLLRYEKALLPLHSLPCNCVLRASGGKVWVVMAQSGLRKLVWTKAWPCAAKMP